MRRLLTVEHGWVKAGRVVQRLGGCVPSGSLLFVRFIRAHYRSQGPTTCASRGRRWSNMVDVVHDSSNMWYVVQTGAGKGRKPHSAGYDTCICDDVQCSSQFKCPQSFLESFLECKGEQPTPVPGRLYVGTYIHRDQSVQT